MQTSSLLIQLHLNVFIVSADSLHTSASTSSVFFLETEVFLLLLIYLFHFPFSFLSDWLMFFLNHWIAD